MLSLDSIHIPIVKLIFVVVYYVRASVCVCVCLVRRIAHKMKHKILYWILDVSTVNTFIRYIIENHFQSYPLATHRIVVVYPLAARTHRTANSLHHFFYLSYATFTYAARNHAMCMCTWFSVVLFLFFTFRLNWLIASYLDMARLRTPLLFCHYIFIHLIYWSFKVLYFLNQRVDIYVLVIRGIDKKKIF